MWHIVLNFDLIETIKPFLSLFMNCHTPFLSVITFILSYFIFFNTELNFALFSLTFFMKEWSHYSLPSCLFVLPVGGGSEIYFTCLCSGKRESRSTLVRKAPFVLVSWWTPSHVVVWRERCSEDICMYKTFTAMSFSLLFVMRGILLSEKFLALNNSCLSFFAA